MHFLPIFNSARHCYFVSDHTSPFPLFNPVPEIANSFRTHHPAIASTAVQPATMAPRILNFITGNANKLREVQAILSSTPVQLQDQNVDLPELQGSIEDISRDKCARAAEAVRFV